MSSSWAPPFASREVISDYEPLRAYLEVARRKGREDLIEKVLLKQEDFLFLSTMVGRGLSLLEVISELKSRLMERVDGEVAREAFNTIGLDVGSELARERLAYILAGWLLEAGKHWGILTFKKLPL
jgi:hypothetical protein